MSKLEIILTAIVIIEFIYVINRDVVKFYIFIKNIKINKHGLYKNNGLVWEYNLNKITKKINFIRLKCINCRNEGILSTYENYNKDLGYCPKCDFNYSKHINGMMTRAPKKDNKLFKHSNLLQWTEIKKNITKEYKEGKVGK